MLLAVTGRGRELAAELRPVGAWSFALQTHSAAEEADAAAELESLGFGALWFPESVGSKDAFAHAATLLEATERIVVATGIANLWARDAMAMANGARALADWHPGRFLLGVGVSHAPSVAARGDDRYADPIERMRAYVAAMSGARYDGPEPSPRPGIVLAALGPRMLHLAAAEADGAHTYFVPVEHTEQARQRLGEAPLLAVEMTAVLEADPARARGIARDFAGRYLELPNYANNLRRLGWSDDDIAGGGSDALIDAVIVWGDEEAIAHRARQHLEAGADHVCVQLRGPGGASDLCLDGYRALAPHLL